MKTILGRWIAPCAIALAALGAALPAHAQTTPALPDDANKALWCATAFNMVAPIAKSHGQNEAADKFTKYAGILTTAAHDSLIKAGFTEDQVKAQAAPYTDKVNKELSPGGQAEFSAVDCSKLADPTATPPVPVAPDATAPAPDAAAPAPGDAHTPEATPDTGTAAPGDAATPAPAAGGTTPSN